MQDKLIALLAGRRGHFQMESGYHGEVWFTLNALFERPEELRPFAAELARRLAAHRIDAVCGPMTGGAKLARLVAAELGLAYFFAERFEPPETKGLFSVKYLLPAAQRAAAHGKAVAIVDDAVSAGSAARGTYTDLSPAARGRSRSGRSLFLARRRHASPRSGGWRWKTSRKCRLACGRPPIARFAGKASPSSVFPKSADPEEDGKSLGVRAVLRLHRTMLLGVVGQRCMSEREPELGLGVVASVDPGARRIAIDFHGTG